MVLILVVRKKLEGKAAEAREAEQEYQAKSFDHEYPAVLSMYG